MTRISCASLVVFINIFSTHAAQLYTEKFDDSLAGWTYSGSNSNLTLAHSPTNGVNGSGAMSIAFGGLPFGQPPTPVDDYILAEGLGSTGNFTGNYVAADAYILGFDFFASNTNPAIFRVWLRSSTNALFLNLTTQVPTANQWYALRRVLPLNAIGNWVDVTAQRESVITHVTSLEFSVRQNGGAAQTYYIDNIFLDRLPASTSVDPSTVTWSYLRTGEVYQVDIATNLAISPVVWTPLTNFIATNDVFNLPLHATNSGAFFRMMMP